MRDATTYGAAFVRLYRERTARLEAGDLNPYFFDPLSRVCRSDIRPVLTAEGFDETMDQDVLTFAVWDAALEAGLADFWTAVLAEARPRGDGWHNRETLKRWGKVALVRQMIKRRNP
jgi:type II secretory pathway component PulK